MHSPKGASGHFYHRAAKKAIALHSNSEYVFGIRIQYRANAEISQGESNAQG
jgi:hypothetical protein